VGDIRGRRDVDYFKNIGDEHVSGINRTQRVPAGKRSRSNACGEMRKFAEAFPLDLRQVAYFSEALESVGGEVREKALSRYKRGKRGEGEAGKEGASRET